MAFGALPLGTTSNSKPVGLKNTGGDDLTITGVSSSDAEFNPVSSCGSLVAPAQSCTISVAFTPSSYGKRTGVISVADNASNSPQKIKVSGSGPDFALSASATALTVTPGQSGSSTLTFTPIAGFNQNIAGTCSGAPAVGDGVPGGSYAEARGSPM